MPVIGGLVRGETTPARADLLGGPRPGVEGPRRDELHAAVRIHRGELGDARAVGHEGAEGKGPHRALDGKAHHRRALPTHEREATQTEGHQVGHAIPIHVAEPELRRRTFEGELAVVIGRRASYVHANEALSYVAGACICNDVSEREWQLERGPTWTKGKSAPTFGPLGPWLVTKDEIADPQNIGLWLDVDGSRRQTGNTRTMIFGVAHIVSYLSQFMTLEPGDVIATGTPPGVGLGMKPPVFLRAGQRMTLGADGLGQQSQLTVQA